MATRMTKVNHAFDVLLIGTDQREFLHEPGVTSVTRLVNSEIYETAVSEGHISDSGWSEIMVFQVWYLTRYNTEEGAGDITEQLTDQVWERYCSDHNPEAEAGDGTDGDGEGIKPEPETKAPYIKTNLRSYPHFDGHLQGWTPFKRKFKAVATMHGHGDVVNNEFVLPTDDTELAEFTARSKVVHAALTLCLAGGTAILKVQQHAQEQDGHLAWGDLIGWYEGKGSTNSVAKRALTTLQTIKLTCGTFQGPEGFIAKFEEALQDLNETGHPFDDVMKKITFLGNIADPQFQQLVTILRLDDDKSYADCVMDLRRMSMEMGETQRDYRRALVRGGPSRMRQVSQVNGSGGRRASNIVSFDYVPPKVWRNLSQAERDRVIQSRGQRRGGRAQSGQRSSGARERMEMGQQDTNEY